MLKKQNLAPSLIQREEGLPLEFFYFAVDPLQEIDLFLGDLAGHYDYVCLLRWLSRVKNPNNVPQIRVIGFHAR